MGFNNSCETNVTSHEILAEHPPTRRQTMPVNDIRNFKYSIYGTCYERRKHYVGETSRLFSVRFDEHEKSGSDDAGRGDREGYVPREDGNKRN